MKWKYSILQPELSVFAFKFELIFFICPYWFILILLVVWHILEAFLFFEAVDVVYKYKLFKQSAYLGVHLATKR